MIRDYWHNFGESRPEYPVRVVNEREARAGAGVLLVLALIAFQNTFSTMDFTLTRLAIIGFGIDFFLRVFISPRLSPSLILGRLLVARQVPDYVGAAQKRFAWALGLAIAAFMAVWIIVLGQAGPVAILGCITCLILLFLESTSGVCVGCWMYNKIWKDQAQLCPGGVCDSAPQRLAIKPVQWAALAGFVGAVALIAPWLAGLPSPQMGHAMQASGDAGGDCTPPAFAVMLGHGEMWKAHNGCS